MKRKTQNQFNARRITMDAMFTVILIVLGAIKLPSIIPGAGFQLSAPYAVCLAYYLGFFRYLEIGICASIIQLILGTHTIYSVIISMVFRIVAGLFIEFCPNKNISLIFSGPFGTAVARLVVSMVTHVSVVTLLIGAAPGMIFTAITSFAVEKIFLKIHINNKSLLEEIK